MNNTYPNTMQPTYTRKWLIQEVNAGLQPEYLLFWGHTSPNNATVGKFCLSQWYHSPFSLFGTTYQTAEHWMMAQKAALFDDADTEAAIVAAQTPGHAKELGRTVKNFDSAVWNAHRLNIVTAGNIYKFNQNKPLGDFLLQTGNKVLVEASPHDAIWGIGCDENHPSATQPYKWKGDNLLGFALMHAREFLAQNGYFDMEQDPLPDTPWFALMG